MRNGIIPVILLLLLEKTTSNNVLNVSEVDTTSYVPNDTELYNSTSTKEKTTFSCKENNNCTNVDVNFESLKKSPCPYICLNNSCSPITGHCVACPPGFHTSHHCSLPCSTGFYGNACKESCSSNCKGSNCHHVLGVCLDGCLPGLEGDLCNRTCHIGTFGDNCSHVCAERCLRQVCHHVTGVCTHGCADGYKGDTCSARCDPGRWGGMCGKMCSSGCVNRSCDSVTGVCWKCVSGRSGETCDTVVARVSVTWKPAKEVNAWEASFMFLAIVALGIISWFVLLCLSFYHNKRLFKKLIIYGELPVTWTKPSMHRALAWTSQADRRKDRVLKELLKLTTSNRMKLGLVGRKPSRRSMFTNSQPMSQTNTEPGSPKDMESGIIRELKETVPQMRFGFYSPPKSAGSQRNSIRLNSHPSQQKVELTNTSRRSIFTRSQPVSQTHTDSSSPKDIEFRITQELKDTLPNMRFGFHSPPKAAGSQRTSIYLNSQQSQQKFEQSNTEKLYDNEQNDEGMIQTSETNRDNTESDDIQSLAMYIKTLSVRDLAAKVLEKNKSEDNQSVAMNERSKRTNAKTPEKKRTKIDNTESDDIQSLAKYLKTLNIDALAAKILENKKSEDNPSLSMNQLSKRTDAITPETKKTKIDNTESDDIQSLAKYLKTLSVDALAAKVLENNKSEDIDNTDSDDIQSLAKYLKTLSVDALAAKILENHKSEDNLPLSMIQLSKRTNAKTPEKKATKIDNTEVDDIQSLAGYLKTLSIDALAAKILENKKSEENLSFAMNQRSKRTDAFAVKTPKYTKPKRVETESDDIQSLTIYPRSLSTAALADQVLRKYMGELPTKNTDDTLLSTTAPVMDTSSTPTEIGLSTTEGYQTGDSVSGLITPDTGSGDTPIISIKYHTRSPWYKNKSLKNFGKSRRSRSKSREMLEDMEINVKSSTDSGRSGSGDSAADQIKPVTYLSTIPAKWNKSSYVDLSYPIVSSMDSTSSSPVESKQEDKPMILSNVKFKESLSTRKSVTFLNDSESDETTTESSEIDSVNISDNKSDHQPGFLGKGLANITGAFNKIVAGSREGLSKVTGSIDRVTARSSPDLSPRPDLSPTEPPHSRPAHSLFLISRLEEWNKKYRQDNAKTFQPIGVKDVNHDIWPPKYKSLYG